MKEHIKEIMTAHYLNNPILKASFATLEDFLGGKTTQDYKDWIAHVEQWNEANAK